MKGVALQTVVLLTLAVIVMAVALWFLVYLVDLEILFPSDLRTLKQYSTCALA